MSYQNNGVPVSYARTDNQATSLGQASYSRSHQAVAGAPEEFGQTSFNVGNFKEGQVILQQSQPNLEDEEEKSEQKIQNLIDKRQAAETKVLFEGEAFDPLKRLSDKEIESYAKKGKEDYLTCLRLSTKSTNQSKYERILKTLEVQGAKNFEDSEFPPHELATLVGTNQAGRVSWKALKWIRPKEIQNYNNYDVFKGEIEPNDIKQGYLGDCYFLSSIASLAEWPNRIKILFENNKPNPYGCHSIRICDKGEWKDIIVDEYFPCISSARGPAFTRGNDAEIWVMLLEKVWAKVNGSYDIIEAGLTRECLHDFTGAPTQTLWLDEQQNAENNWQKLLIAEKRNYAMTAGSSDSVSQGELDKVGIISGHAYSLLGAFDVKFRGQSIRLVKLRNPWGEREWSGDWCDGDSKWNELSPADINKLQITNKVSQSVNDGIFFMTYSDFRKYFTDAQICYIHDGFKYVSIKSSTSKKNGRFFKMKITQGGRYFLTVNQKSKRKYSKEFQKEFKYSTATIVVAKKENNGTYKYIEGQQKDDREVWTAEADNAYLEPGTYIVYVKVQWRYKDVEDFVLSSYGAGTPIFTEITKIECKTFFSETYFNHALTVSKKPKKILNNGDAWILLDQTDDGYFYLAVENKSQKNLQCEFRFNKMPGLKLKKPFKGQTVNFMLKPSEHETAILRVKDYKQLQGLSLSQTVQFK